MFAAVPHNATANDETQGHDPPLTGTSPQAHRQYFRTVPSKTGLHPLPKRQILQGRGTQTNIQQHLT